DGLGELQGDVVAAVGNRQGVLEGAVAFRMIERGVGGTSDAVGIRKGGATGKAGVRRPGVACGVGVGRTAGVNADGGAASIGSLGVRIVTRLAIRIIATLRVGIGGGEIEALHWPRSRIALVQSRAFVALGGTILLP